MLEIKPFTHKLLNAYARAAFVSASITKHAHRVCRSRSHIVYPPHARHPGDSRDTPSAVHSRADVACANGGRKERWSASHSAKLANDANENSPLHSY